MIVPRKFQGQNEYIREVIQRKTNFRIFQMSTLRTTFLYMSSMSRKFWKIHTSKQPERALEIEDLIEK